MGQYSHLSFSLHNSECGHLLKFSDDFIIVGGVNVGKGAELKGLEDSFVDCNERNHLVLNMAKTKEMVVDLSCILPYSPLDALVSYQVQRYVK